jgi:hypothetical protein
LLGPVTFEAVLGAGAAVLGTGASRISLVDGEQYDENAGRDEDAAALDLPKKSLEPIHQYTVVVEPLTQPVVTYY